MVATGLQRGAGNANPAAARACGKRVAADRAIRAVGYGTWGNMRSFDARRGRPGVIAAAILLAALPLAGCFTETYYHGYVVQEGALEQVPLAATQEQVLIVLGTPSTVATVSGEVFYYISERAEKTAFLPQKVVNQRVIAVYFDKNRRVERVADYGMRDGRIFDFVSRTTPTAGRELNYLTYVFKIFGKD
jgi:outer membrane protein assembly factor BamE (lipoprotein component of BamABCDE complex)